MFYALSYSNLCNSYEENRWMYKINQAADVKEIIGRLIVKKQYQ
ncbi:hypothetical protein SAMN04487930_10897 [Cytophaga hutchinsonii ATCC 33406]|nr:hypothetical protein SAMN04487930_10897 [Cytophaga hutchinsonii ATCC 33406]